MTETQTTVEKIKPVLGRDENTARERGVGGFKRGEIQFYLL